MRSRFIAIACVLLVIVMAVSSTVFSIDQRQYAIVFQFGEIKDIITEPGIAFKLPFIQNVRVFDKRILTMESAEPERFPTAENKYVLVDSYIKWRISDVRLFYTKFSGGDEAQARVRLAQTVNSGLRAEFGKRTVHEVVSGERDKIMSEVVKRADADLRTLGVEIVDVRLKRVELPTEVNESVYRRMEAERKRVANELRSQGGAEAEKIKADADKQREIILAEAYREAQMIKGEGDAKAAHIYARAFGHNPEFYAFYRSMEAYRNTFKSKSDVMVVEPNTEFFKYLKSSRPGKSSK